MKPAKSSATGCCRSAITRRSRRRCRGRHGVTSALWTVDAMAAAMGARATGALPAGVRRLSIDSRTLARGRGLLRHPGRQPRRPRLRRGGAEGRRRAGRGRARASATRFAADAPLLVVDDVLEALARACRAPRARASPPNRSPSPARSARPAPRKPCGWRSRADGDDPCLGRLLQQPLGRAAVARALSAQREFAVFEIGMNHAGEIAPLARLVRPHVAIITTIEPVHLEYFGSLEEIADAKAEIFLGLEPGGAAVINRDNAHFARLRRAAEAAGVARIVSFGEHAQADARLEGCALAAGHARPSQARILGQRRHLQARRAGPPSGAQFARGAGGRVARSAPISRWPRWRSPTCKPAAGRGARARLKLPGGSALLIDESYNANPASMRAALALLGQAPIGRAGRRIAVLGDMLELGAQGPRPASRRWPSRSLAARRRSRLLLRAADARAVGGSSLRAPRRLCRDRGGAGASVLGAMRAGDAVMVKGSLGSQNGADRQGARTRSFPNGRARTGGGRLKA